MPLRIALLEDDTGQVSAMNSALSTAGHHCHFHKTGKSFTSALRQESFDLLIIDWFLPDVTGDEVVRWVRQHVDWLIPILVVTVRSDEESVVKMLELGADDYLAKPVRPAEMLARVQALVRRSPSSTDARNNGLFQFGVFTVDTDNRVIKRKNKIIDLTTKEFELTLFLFRNSGRLVSRGHMLNSVWGYSPDLNTRTVDTHVSRIRQKLDLDTDSGWRLRTVYQHGYRMEQVVSDETPPLYGA